MTPHKTCRKVVTAVVGQGFQRISVRLLVRKHQENLEPSIYTLYVYAVGTSVHWCRCRSTVEMAVRDS